MLFVTLPFAGVRDRYLFTGLPRFAPSFPYGWTVNAPRPVLPVYYTRKDEGYWSTWP